MRDLSVSRIQGGITSILNEATKLEPHDDKGGRVREDKSSSQSSYFPIPVDDLGYRGCQDRQVSTWPRLPRRGSVNWIHRVPCGKLRSARRASASSWPSVIGMGKRIASIGSPMVCRHTVKVIIRLRTTFSIPTDHSMMPSFYFTGVRLAHPQKHDPLSYRSRVLYPRTFVGWHDNG